MHVCWISRYREKQAEVLIGEKAIWSIDRYRHNKEQGTPAWGHCPLYRWHPCSLAPFNSKDQPEHFDSAGRIVLPIAEKKGGSKWWKSKPTRTLRKRCENRQLVRWTKPQMQAQTQKPHHKPRVSAEGHLTSSTFPGVAESLTRLSLTNTLVTGANRHTDKEHS